MGDFVDPFGVRKIPGQLMPDQQSRTAGQDAMDAQINQNAIALETKRKDLYQQRLDIIKSQGGQNWKPGAAAPATTNIPGSTPEASAATSSLAGMPQDSTDVLTKAIGQARGGNIGKQQTAS